MYNFNCSLSTIKNYLGIKKRRKYKTSDLKYIYKVIGTRQGFLKHSLL